MIHLALTFATACYGLALIFNLYRVIRAPTLADRILALDTMTVNVIALLLFYGMARDTKLTFEATLFFAAFGFIGTVAYAKFILRGDIIE